MRFTILATTILAIGFLRPDLAHQQYSVGIYFLLVVVSCYASALDLIELQRRIK